MFRQLFDMWNRKDLLRQAFNDTIEMLGLSRDFFMKAAAPLFMGHKAEKQMIYDTDKKINVFEIEIRKKVLEHLSISPHEDTTAALVLITIAVDIERLGDYSKNFFELWELYGGRLLHNSVFDILNVVNDRIGKMFDNTIDSFKNADMDIAHQVMNAHIENSKNCEEIIAILIKSDELDETLSCNQRVLVALTARYLKRVSAHLKNIASSVVNPFDTIGFKPSEGSGEIEEYDD